MKAGIPSTETRGRTITLYIDKEPFKTALSIDNEDTIYLFLVKNNGEILYGTSGPYTKDGENAILEILRTFSG